MAKITGHLDVLHEHVDYFSVTQYNELDRVIRYANALKALKRYN